MIKIYKRISTRQEKPSSRDVPKRDTLKNKKLLVKRIELSFWKNFPEYFAEGVPFGNVPHFKD
jgi:hypothetical protein